MSQVPSYKPAQVIVRRPDGTKRVVTGTQVKGGLGSGSRARTLLTNQLRNSCSAAKPK